MSSSPATVIFQPTSGKFRRNLASGSTFKVNEAWDDRMNVWQKRTCHNRKTFTLLRCRKKQLPKSPESRGFS